MINCGSGISPLGPSKKVKAAIRKAVKNIGVYPGSELLRLRRLFSSRFGLAEDRVLFSGSLNEIIHLIPAVFTARKVLIAGPALSIYEKASSAVGAEITYVIGNESTNFAAGAGEIREKLDGADLFFIANPNRITGRLTGREELCETLTIAAGKGVISVVDESLIEFTDDDSFYDCIAGTDNIIILRTTAYFYGLAGLELAFAVSSPATIARLNAGKYSAVNTLSVEAAITALKDKTYRKLAKEYTRAEKMLLLRSINKTDGIECLDSDSNMLLIKMNFPEGRFRSLAENGFSWNACGISTTSDSDFLSLSVMDHDKNLKFIRALQKLPSGPRPL